MTPQELESAVKQGEVDSVTALIAGATEKERRGAAKTILTLRRGMGVFGWSPNPKFQKQNEASVVALFGVCSLTEIKRLGRFESVRSTIPERTFEVLAARRPEWLPQWVEWAVEGGCPHEFGSGVSAWLVIRRLIREGICERPNSDGYTYSMIQCYLARVFSARGARQWSPEQWEAAQEDSLKGILLNDPALLEQEIWKLFEVEGLDRISLAADRTWANVLIDFSNQGILDRKRLLSESLRALERDFKPYRAGWFSRFHEALKPDMDERVAIADDYLALVSSKTPATVSLALKALATMDKAGRLDAEMVVDSVGAAMAAREKGTVIAALRLLEKAAKRSPALAGRAATAAADALIHPASEVQAKALDVIELAPVGDDPRLGILLASRIDDVAPSLRDRVSNLLPKEETRESSRSFVEDLDIEPLVQRAAILNSRWSALAGVDEVLCDLRSETLAAPPLALDPLSVPRLDPDRRMEPVNDIDSLVALFAAVIENGGPADDIERVMDGVSRLCAHRPPDFAQRTSALRKRARTLLGLDTGSLRVGGGANFVCRLAGAWIDGTIVPSPHTDTSLYSFFEQRSMEIACRAAHKVAMPLLAAPTHAGGWIDPRIAVERFRSRPGRLVRRAAPKAGIIGFAAALAAEVMKADGPDRFDVIQALLRLAPDHRAEALRMAHGIPGEHGAALRYALGAKETEIGRDAALWIAAARARDPHADHPDIERRFPGLGPAAGQAARICVVWQCEKGKQRVTELRCVPVAPKRIPADLPTVLHFAWKRPEHMWQPWFIWYDLAIESIIWPLNRDPWLAVGAYTIGDNVNWWEARWNDRAFIEMLADPDTPLTGNGLDILAFGLASREPGQSGSATDVLIAGVGDGRVTGMTLGGALAKAAQVSDVVLSRWARTLADAARISPLHAAVIHRGLEGLFASRPPRKPAEMLALFQLARELCVQTGVPMKSPEALSWLSSISGAGKAATTAAELCRMPEESNKGWLRAAAAEQLVGRLDRAERWERMHTVENGPRRDSSTCP